MAAFRRGRRDQRGMVGVNLVLVMAFALYAVIMLSRTTLAAGQIDDHVREIVTEVGPGSNISRLEETEKLNSVAQTAEGILAASRPLADRAQEIVDTVRRIDGSVAAIEGNANEINSSVHSIHTTSSSLLPVVEAINGQGSSAPNSSGVVGINLRADAVRSNVAGIGTDLATVARTVGGAGNSAHTIDAHVSSVDCALSRPGAGLLGATGGLLGGVLRPAATGSPSCP